MPGWYSGTEPGHKAFYGNSSKISADKVQKHGEFSCRATCDTAGSLWVDDGAVEAF